MLKRNPSGIAQLDADIDTFLGKVANDLVKEAQRRAPVQTGRLQRSIKAMKATKGEYSIGSDLEYADEVEERVGFLAAAARTLPTAVIRNRKRT